MLANEKRIEGGLKMDAAYAFVKFINETQYQDIPAATIAVAKKSLLDILGLGLAGTKEEEMPQLYELVSGWGGRPDSSVIGYGGKLPCPEAAFVNAAMCHAPECDDTYWRAGLHPSASVVPSAFAVSEMIGGVDGKTFLAAQCVATEFGIRVGKATLYKRPDVSVMAGWDNSAILGFFMAAAIGGKLLGFDRETLHNALGLAYSQAAGNEQCIRDGALTKRMGPGFGARGGLTAALMAQKGMTGAKDIFDEGKTSYYVVYHAGHNSEPLFKGLGTEYLMTGMAHKANHCTLSLAATINAGAQLVKENNIKLNEIEEVLVYSATRNEVVSFPEEIKKKPRTVADAQFSIPWTAACGIVRGKADKEDFDADARKDADMLAVAAKVKSILDPSITAMEHTNMTIRTKRGEFSVKITDPYGTIGNPMTFEDIAKKFKKYSLYGVKQISDKNKQKVIDMVENLEDVKDVTKIMQLIA
jgi:2-methylcitrate dehydratase PrpD